MPTKIEQNLSFRQSELTNWDVAYCTEPKLEVLRHLGKDYLIQSYGNLAVAQEVRWHIYEPIHQTPARFIDTTEVGLIIDDAEAPRGTTITGSVEDARAHINESLKLKRVFGNEDVQEYYRKWLGSALSRSPTIAVVGHYDRPDLQAYLEGRLENKDKIALIESRMAEGLEVAEVLLDINKPTIKDLVELVEPFLERQKSKRTGSILKT